MPEILDRMSYDLSDKAYFRQLDICLHFKDTHDVMTQPVMLRHDVIFVCIITLEGTVEHFF